MKMFEIISNNTWDKRGKETHFKYYMKSKSIELHKEKNGNVMVYFNVYK